MELFCEFRYLISEERKNYGLKTEVKIKLIFENYLTLKKMIKLIVENETEFL